MNSDSFVTALNAATKFDLTSTSVTLTSAQGDKGQCSGDESQTGLIVGLVVGGVLLCAAAIAIAVCYQQKLLCFRETSKQHQESNDLHNTQNPVTLSMRSHATIAAPTVKPPPTAAPRPPSGQIYSVPQSAPTAPPVFTSVASIDTSAKFCAQCGQPTAPTAQFYGECGTPVPPPTYPTHQETKQDMKQDEVLQA